MARWYVTEAQRQVNALRRRISELGYTIPTDSAVDVELLAEAYLDCAVFRRPALTERLALAHLQQAWGLTYEVDSTADLPLAGALYVTADGSRAIFLEASDQTVRQRFSLAHELGHLVLEAEAALEVQPDLLASVAQTLHGTNIGLRKYGRCPASAIGWDANEAESVGQEGNVGARTAPLDVGLQQRSAETHGLPGAGPASVVGSTNHPRSKDVREWRANFFAAELLMPYAGIRRMVQRFGGNIGFRTDTDLNRLVEALVETYRVSPASARLRLTKDLGITPSTRQANHDLFG